MYAAKASIQSDAAPSITWDFVSDLKNFPTFLSNIREIQPLDVNLWEWCLQGILGIPLFCKTKVTIIKSSKKVYWDAIEGPLATFGWVQVDALASGSNITLSLTYQPKTAVLSDVFKPMFQNPQQILKQDLHKLSSLLLLETNYAETSTASPKLPTI